MTRYYISSQIHHCHVDDGIVLLDLLTQKYFALPPEWKHAFSIVSQGNTDSNDLTESDAHALDALHNAGVVTRFPPQRTLRTPVWLPASGSMLATMYTRPTQLCSWHTAIFAHAFITTAYRLKMNSLRTIVEKLRTHKPKSVATNELSFDKLRGIVDRFRWYRLWVYTAAGACLFDSLLLVELLHRYGIDATLVLGVQSKPFGAHAWAQWHDIVLNDSVEHTARFTPILTA